MKAEIAVLLAGIFGGLSGIAGQIIFSKLEHKQKIEYLRIQKIHGERINIVSKLYELLEDFNQKMSSLISPAEMAGDLPKEDKLKIAGEAGEKFRDYYSKRKIYFDENIDNLLAKINTEFLHAWIDFTMYPPKKEILGGRDAKEKWKWWIKAWKKVTEEIPPIKKEIEKEFRKILGAN